MSMHQTFTIEELKPGMYVDAVLEQTSDVRVKTQGLVKTEQSIQTLASKGVTKVSVDLDKSTFEQEPVPDEPLEDITQQQSNVNSEPFEREISRASKLYEDAKFVQNRIFECVENGKEIEIDDVENICNGLFHSIHRNRDALSCLTRMQSKDGYLLQHSLNVAILMGIFASYLELPSEQSKQLIVGAMLLDVGMIGARSEVLNKPSALTEQEVTHVQNHVELGFHVLKRSNSLSDLSLQIVLEHHERLDGSGYPHGKSAEQLDQFSRMAAIIDSYDAIISHRPYKEALTPFAAFKELKSQSGDKYDEQLLNEFIKCLGIHPVGSIVKMKSNRLGIVVNSNYKNPLTPVVELFYSIASKSYISPKIVDLSSKKSTDQIVKSVRPEEYKLDMLKFFKEMLLG